MAGSWTPPAPNSQQGLGAGAAVRAPREGWALDPAWAHLNHGSYGARTTSTLRLQQKLRTEFESNPTGWRETAYPQRITESKAAMARFLGAPADSLVFLPSVTAGLTSALRAAVKDLGPQDEILLLEHSYGSCRITAEQVAAEHRIKVRRVPFPDTPLSSDHLAHSILAVVGSQTRIVVLDHASSRTGVVYPLAAIIEQLSPEITTIVDGAHGPGMLDMREIDWGKGIYVGAGYKWLCGPLGTAFMVSPPHWQAHLAPTTLSHGWETPGAVPRYHAAFDWPGGMDPVPWLSLASSIQQLDQLTQDAWSADAQMSRLLHRRAGDLANRWHSHWNTSSPLPDEVQGAMRLLRLPEPLRTVDLDQLTRALRAHFVESKVTSLRGETMLRLSAHLYVTEDDVDRAIWAVGQILS